MHGRYRLGVGLHGSGAIVLRQQRLRNIDLGVGDQAAILDVVRLLRRQSCEKRIGFGEVTHSFRDPVEMAEEITERRAGGGESAAHQPVAAEDERHRFQEGDARATGLSRVDRISRRGQDDAPAILDVARDFLGFHIGRIAPQHRAPAWRELADSP